MMDEWSLKGKIKQLVEEGSATIKDVYDCFLYEDIETLRKKLIEDIDEAVDFWRNRLHEEHAQYYIDAFLYEKANINKHFGVK